MIFRLFYSSNAAVAHLTKLLTYCLGLILFSSLGGCKAFKQEKLFQTEAMLNSDRFDQKLESLKKGYIIQKYDILAISVFPNNGEQLVDQTGDYPSNNGGGAQGNNLGMGQNRNLLGGNQDPLNTRTLPFNNMRPLYYTVNEKGDLNLPVAGPVKAAGLRLIELDSILTKKYSSYIKSPYVASQFVNKRVVVMGALGDKVVPLTNDGTSLLELLSTASGGNSSRAGSLGGGIGGNTGNLQRLGKPSEIQLIRGEAGNREVLIIDLTTMTGLNQLETHVMPNDIIYIPPRRRLDRQTLSDISAVITPVLSAISLLTTILVLTRSN